MDTSAFNDFPSAAEAALGYLKQNVGLDLWAVARKDGANWVTLRVTANDYRLAEADRFPWGHSLCDAIAAGDIPTLAEDVETVPSLASENRRRMRIGSYAGIPLRRPDGTLYGVLCGIDPDVRSDYFADSLPLLGLLGRLLNTTLASDMRAMNEALRLERVRTESLTDPITGLGNRRYWAHHLAAEESRCARSGEPAAVVMLDVNDAARRNEDVLRRAGNVLRLGSRVHDVVARVGGNSLAILAVNCNKDSLGIVTDRLRDALTAEGIRVDMAAALRPDEGLTAAWQEADNELRNQKRSPV